MIPTLTLILKRNPIHLSLLFIFILLGYDTPIAASPPEVSRLLQANRWKGIEYKYTKNAPTSPLEHYAYALSLLENRRGVFVSKNLPFYIKAFQHFMKGLNINCSNANSIHDLEKCLRGASPESYGSYKHPIPLIIIHEAARFANNLDMSSLSGLFATLASLKNFDSYTESIFQKRLEQLTRQKNIQESSHLAKRTDLQNFKSPYTNFMRARALVLNHEKDQALHYYIKAAQETNETWILKGIWSDVKAYFPESLNSSNKNHRWLVAMNLGMSKDELKSFKRTYSSSEIIDTATNESAISDGYFLLKTEQENGLIKMAEHFQNVYSRNTKYIEDWGNSLLENQKYQTVLELLKPYRYTMNEVSSLWGLSLKALRGKKRNKDSIYFNEVLNYLKKYPWHTSIQDLLMEALVGNETGKINWAEDKHWTRAAEELPKFNTSGRFFHWLRVYYRTKNKIKELAELENNFYVYAPGSFYIEEIWNSQSTPTRHEYELEWSKVNSRKDYLAWITKYGGVQMATSFLASKNIEKYFDPKSKDLWAEIERSSLIDNELVKILFLVGEWNTAQQLYRELKGLVGGKNNTQAEKRKFLKEMVMMGKWSGLLNVQIYYLRQLLWESGIPLDPYSLPPAIARHLYPRPYLSLVEKHSKTYGTQMNMNYALMHQESLFQEGVVSRSGAQGLMQIMPATSREIAKQIYKEKNYDIHNPEVNIQFGIYFFSKLYKQYEKNFRWSVIAYNGGPGNLRKWKRLYYNEDFFQFLEALPNAESRNYCRITSENLMRYNVIYQIYKK